MAEIRKIHPISWIKAALKDFRRFPNGVQAICMTALTIAAEGGKADLSSRCRAWVQAYLKSRWRSKAMHTRVVYAVQLADEIWVIHAFQKKSTTGTKTPPREIELIRNQLKHLQGDAP